MGGYGSVGNDPVAARRWRSRASRSFRVATNRSGFASPSIGNETRTVGPFTPHRAPDGLEVWGRGTYSRIEPPALIEYVDSFSDPHGQLALRDGYPPETLVRVTFEEVSDGTKVTVRHRGLPRDIGESQGWMEMLERLDTVVTTLHQWKAGQRP